MWWPYGDEDGNTKAELPAILVPMVLLRESCKEEASEKLSSELEMEVEEQTHRISDLPRRGSYKARYFTKREMWDILQEVASALQGEECEIVCLETDIYEDQHALEYLQTGNCNK